MKTSQQLQWLLEDKYGWPRQKSLAAVADPDTAQFSPEIVADLNALDQGLPLAYIIGWIEFGGCRIDLRHRTLIPRPETEYWVEECLRRFSDRRPARVLDLCSGSGCIATVLAKNWPEVAGVAADIDPNAIEQTKLNLASIEGSKWVVVESNTFENVTGKFELILTNPPYVDESSEYDESVLHEPEQAIFAEEKGLAVIRQIISQAKNHLQPGGELWIEFAADQAEQVRQLATGEGWQAKIEQDQYGKDRWAILTRSA